MLKQLRSKLENNESCTTIEVMKFINFLRADIEFKKPIAHKNLLTVIRREFEHELNEGELLPSYYQDPSGKINVMYELSPDMVIQVLLIDSPVIRRAAANQALAHADVFSAIAKMYQKEVQERGWEQV